MNSFSQRFTASGLIFWLILAAVSVYFLYPIRQKIKFGIDLVGGTYITLRVQTDKAIEHELREKLQDLDNSLKNLDKPRSVGHKFKNTTLEINFSNKDDALEAYSVLKREVDGVVADVNDKNLNITFTPKIENEIKKQAVSGDIEVLRTRLNSIGAEEIKVAPQGETDIVIELPDVADFSKAKEMIGTPAHLEFKLVEGMASTKDQLLDEFGGEIPSGMEILPLLEGDRKLYVLVADYAEVSGRHLKDAKPGIGGQYGTDAVVSFKLTASGAKKFYELTSENIGKNLAIILDNKVISAPTIQQGIRSEGQITGSRTMDAAKELATLLKSGAFVAPVKFEEERSVGPSLGYESIKSGVISCLVGLILLFLFSVIVYKISGFFAFLALVYNLLLMLFAMSLFKATLTLPGIAGMVLTIGMAVDASILIFEKIKELLRHGETVNAAINNGFKDAMAVILDANITTFIVGIVLFYFGTGPIKGFAVTLMLGIVATLIAGLFFLKSIFKTFLMKSNVQKLSI
jgi:preprotein translocase subunit SecD